MGVYCKIHLINILIRTSNRPELFRRAVDSVLNQTYRNIRIIVSVDNPKAAAYAKEFECVHVFKKPGWPYFYNLYCNELKRKVTEGYFFFLDDDDFLDNPFVIEQMIPHLEEDKAVLCQFKRNGRPKPPNIQMKDRIIWKGWVGLPCLWLHHSKKDLAHLTGMVDYGDYLYIKKISELMPVKFVQQIVVATDRRSWGK